MNMHVVVGVLINEKGEVLIALRPPHVVQPGLWEFPGGKVEPGESLENALIREFHEEIGVDVQRLTFLLKIERFFPEKRLHLYLHAFRILQYSGIPAGCENQEIRWVPIHTLKNYTFPEANAGIVELLVSAPG